MNYGGDLKRVYQRFDLFGLGVRKSVNTLSFVYTEVDSVIVFFVFVSVKKWHQGAAKHQHIHL